MRTSTDKSRVNVIVLAILLIWADHLAAQDAGLQIEEIIVTAQKREQNLNDVGVAVTVFTGDDIRGQ